MLSAVPSTFCRISRCSNRFLTLPTVMLVQSSSVADPDHFDTDPDPTFDFETDPDPLCFKEECAMYLKQYFLYILT
jgi:hypothetical protein